MQPAALTRLQAIADYVAAGLHDGQSPEAIIQGMIREHRATRKLAPWTNTLRAGGVSATCTWSEDKGLLDGWRLNATRRLAVARMPS